MPTLPRSFTYRTYFVQAMPVHYSPAEAFRIVSGDAHVAWARSPTDARAIIDTLLGGVAP